MSRIPADGILMVLLIILAILAILYLVGLRVQVG